MRYGIVVHRNVIEAKAKYCGAVCSEPASPSRFTSAIAGLAREG